MEYYISQSFWMVAALLVGVIGTKLVARIANSIMMHHADDIDELFYGIDHGTRILVFLSLTLGSILLFCKSGLIHG